MTFNDFNFKDKLNIAIKEAGFREPSPIQKEAIPIVLDGNDLIAQAHTGTGKTAAFGLPILNKIDPKNKGEMLVVVPTRELAMQVSDELYKFGKFLGLKSATVYGGVSYDRQIRLIKGANIIVATPGRLIDLIKSKKIELNSKYVILDEADEMLDMGFLDDIKKIFNYLPKSRQTLLFSATMSKQIKELAQKILNNPKSVSITGTNVTNTKIKQYFYVVEERERQDALIRLLNYKQPTKAIIFCRMKREVDNLSNFLNAQGFNTKGLHGDLNQRQREDVIRAFKANKLDILIATDVAARGLDVNDISHVFNYHIPFDSESYVHRIGRTGRAGKAGMAISIVTPDEFRGLQKIQKDVGSQIESRIIPKIKEVQAKTQEDFIKKIASTPIDNSVDELMDRLLEEFDIGELTYKMASLLFAEQKIKGKDKIGKNKSEIAKLFEKAKKEKRTNKNRRNFRFRNSRRQKRA